MLLEADVSTLGTTLIQSKTSSVTATSSLVLTLDAATRPGNAIAVYVYSGLATETCNGSSGNVTDDAGNTYQFVAGAFTNNTGNPTVWLFRCLNALSATQITATFTGSGTFKKVVIAREYVHEAIGIPTTENGLTGTATGTITHTKNTTYPDEILLGVCISGDVSGTATLANGSNFSNFVEVRVTDAAFSGINSLSLGIADLYVYGSPVGTTKTFDLTAGGTDLHWRMSLAEIVLEGGVKRVGDGTFGIGDGGAGISG